MNANDPRHGSRAGYIAGCRDDCCRNPHIRYQKRSRLRYLREGSQYVDRAPILRCLAGWADHGVTPRAVAMGAGVSESTLQGILRDHYRPERATARATLAVTWDDLPDTALVNAELTRARVFSLMAAGHPLWWICEQVDGLAVSGKWRTQEKVTLGLARSVQAVYDRAAPWGPSPQTRAKARGRGHITPAAWDDPGTPAAPNGWQVRAVPAPDHDRKSYVDHAAVERRLAGDRSVRLHPAEAAEVVARALLAGRSYNWVEEHTGLKPERYTGLGVAS